MHATHECTFSLSATKGVDRLEGRYDGRHLRGRLSRERCKMLWLLIVAATLHELFMISELFPWPNPLSLQFAGEKLPNLPDDETLSDARKQFVAARQQLRTTIVHNAGSYNGIVASVLLEQYSPERWLSTWPE